MTPTASLSQLSKAELQVGPERGFRYRLTVNGREIPDRNVLSLTVNYAKDGTSAAEFEVRSDLRGLDDAAVKVEAGYGRRLATYFDGYLFRPGYRRRTATTEAEAHGPFKSLSNQSFDKPARYVGSYLDSFFADLSRRAGRYAPRLTVLGGRDYQIQDAIFAGETTLLEGADSVAGPAGYVYCDRPGHQILVMPKPRPGAGSLGGRVHYTPHHYEPGDFDPQPTGEGPYHKVAVFKRDASGKELLRVDALVANRGLLVPPPTNRIYWVTDFDGDAASALQVAHDTATALGDGIFAGRFSVGANPELFQWDGFSCEVWEAGFATVYSCMVEEITLDAKAKDTTISYVAVRTAERPLPAPGGAPVALSPYVVRFPEDRPPFGIFGTATSLYLDPQADPNDWIGVDEADASSVWFDPALAPTGVSGTDAAGNPFIEATP